MASIGTASRMGDGASPRRLRSALVLGRTAWHEPTRRRLWLAVAAAVVSALAFARIAEDYLTNDPLARWDVSFAGWLADERGSLGTSLFRIVTFFGSPAVALAVAAVACVWSYRRGRTRDALLLPFVLGGGEALNLVLKLVFHRARPEVGFVHLDTYSFPSGHAMISTAAYGALAFLAWSRLRTARSRVLLVTGTALIVTLIGFSRLYLGVHYLSDVLAGVSGGAFWLAACVALDTGYGARLALLLEGSRADQAIRRLIRA